MNKTKILVIGACGQIGAELIEALRQKYGRYQVLAADIRDKSQAGADNYPYIKLDVMNKAQLLMLCREENITQVYLLAAMLSATGEQEPTLAWQLNVDGLLNTLDVAVKCEMEKVFWPSSIAVFGPDAPKQHSPQANASSPSTVYGISKAAGEYWCRYYHEKHGLDVRSLRYPGLISYKSPPGGGTTDYAVDIFHQAVSDQRYLCFLKPGTMLPMMYMPDAIRATLELMDAPSEKLRIRTSYNLSAMSFTPEELGQEIGKHIKDFKLDYLPDFRQQIADSWPDSIDDYDARVDWAWQAEFGLKEMVRDMLSNVGSKDLLSKA
ncbi:putative epimerase/dehydratase SA0511 [Pedobacter sp. Bi27]|uniref:NAD-dependent epimerase/dehydratase family protein n=1 Tax=Pedobacter sp. Bi27 TaxID=2822351 RepID=UPI001DB9B34C|nr:NAD-dependent epimerase/dehydratase family protein [Pedobacter sp. Bi27]CAH0281568.1 putative epimerase/dehydratase SA0511 [Pedobacter sp. Bi27]